ncbi:MAG: hypothetical protein KKH01_08700 [Firmicutes bacterium]|nr:hypothetical protein [Bacillota bacterium]
MLSFLFSIRKIKKNKPGYLSPMQIVNGVVNLVDAKRKLNNREFELVHFIHLEISKYNEKKLFNSYMEYLEFLSYLICQFDIIIPYYKICGNPNYVNSIDMNDENEKHIYRLKSIEHLKNNIYKFEGDTVWDQMIIKFRTVFYGF